MCEVRKSVGGFFFWIAVLIKGFVAVVKLLKILDIVFKYWRGRCGKF